MSNQILKNSIKQLSEHFKFSYEDAFKILDVTTKRKSCEYNYLEAAFAASLLSPIQSKEDINTNLKNNQIIIDTDETRNEYIQEISNTNKKIQYDDINSATRHFRDNITANSRIFLMGKSIKNETIKTLTNQLSKKENKADIFATHDEKHWEGFSIKETKDCTQTNWPLDRIETETNNTTILKDTRCKWLSEKCNIQRVWRNGISEEQKKEIRSKYNNMFKEDNPYKNAIDTFITSMSNDDIKKYLAMAYGSSVHKKINNLNMIQYTPSYGLENISDIYDNIMSSNVDVIKDDGTVNMMDKHNVRTYYSDNAAKMWHYFTIDGKIKYRSEIRWKGNCWDSMQWFFHKI
tara:strand:- start:1073 stop:2116 length:1044 start_codon:yes stop_codon:yes gene_type:complete